MSRLKKKAKQAALRAGNTLNRSANSVTDKKFLKSDGFFDPQDLMQVKYEMLRLVREEQSSVAGAAAVFGFSRVSYYKILHAFQKDGMNGLLPRPHGPQKAHKLTGEVMDYVQTCMQETPGISVQDIIVKLRQELGLHVHIRSLQRALAKRKKNG